MLKIMTLNHGFNNFWMYLQEVLPLRQSFLFYFICNMYYPYEDYPRIPSHHKHLKAVITSICFGWVPLRYSTLGVYVYAYYVVMRMTLDCLPSHRKHTLKQLLHLHLYWVLNCYSVLVILIKICLKREIKLY